MEEDRANVLRGMKICRFCLNDDEELTNIYQRDTRDGKQSVPLPLQIMACVAIEVFANDGMPQLICKTCRELTLQAYAFKTTCKKSDDALKLFLATGQLVKPSNEPLYYQVLSQARKRLPDPSSSSEPKRIKTETGEVLTLNYTAPIQARKHDQSQSSVSGIPDELDDSQEGTTADEEDEKINPTLKVSQVATDVYPCPHCDRSFPLQQLLDLHKANHERERSFSCDECGRKFFTKYDLGKHVQTHSDNKPFSCVICGKLFSRESLLHRHEKIHIEAPKYLCTSCDKTFLTRDDLDIHSEKHKKKRPYTCGICSKSFVFKQGLERHEMSHSHEKPHKCNYCEARFTSPIKLTRHVTSHAGLRPYPCKMCGRTFLLSHHLTRHMRSHYAAKSPAVPPVGRYKCDVCSMSFRRKDSLINHSAIHSMVNLKCVICNTAFENAKMVKEHITTHLSGLPYPCDKCDYSFETQDQLEEHEVKHAEMEYEEQIEREVTKEAQQDYLDEEDDEYSGDDIAEFTLTNDIENPEVVRRSKREPKIKNYAQFLKDELGSDAEEMADEDSGDEVVIPSSKSSNALSEDTIKPIIRTEGTRVYTRKTTTTVRIKSETPSTNQFLLATASPEQINQSTVPTLENLGLTKQAVKLLPNKQFVDMKIGDKTVRVQKLMMTKAEIEAMAKEGKIEMKGNTILLKKGSLDSSKAKMQHPVVKPLTIESIIDDPKPSLQKPQVKKTYQRRTASIDESNAVVAEEQVPLSVEENTEVADEEAVPTSEIIEEPQAEEVVS